MSKVTADLKSNDPAYDNRLTANHCHARGETHDGTTANASSCREIRRPLFRMPPPDLAEIEAALITGAPLRAIASTFATTPAALHRHRAGHMACAGAAARVDAVSAPVPPISQRPRLRKTCLAITPWAFSATLTVPSDQLAGGRAAGAGTRAAAVRGASRGAGAGAGAGAGVANRAVRSRARDPDRVRPFVPPCSKEAPPCPWRSCTVRGAGAVQGDGHPRAATCRCRGASPGRGPGRRLTSTV